MFVVPSCLATLLIIVPLSMKPCSNYHQCPWCYAYFVSAADLSHKYFKSSKLKKINDNIYAASIIYKDSGLKWSFESSGKLIIIIFIAELSPLSTLLLLLLILL